MGDDSKVSMDDDRSGSSTICLDATKRLVTISIIELYDKKSSEEETMDDHVTKEIPMNPSLKGILVDAEHGKALNISPNLSP